MPRLRQKLAGQPRAQDLDVGPRRSEQRPCGTLMRFHREGSDVPRDRDREIDSETKKAVRTEKVPCSTDTPSLASESTSALRHQHLPREACLLKSESESESVPAMWTWVKGVFGVSPVQTGFLDE